MRPSGRLNPESIANEYRAIQIVDTLKTLDTVVIKGLLGSAHEIYRTAVTFRYLLFADTIVYLIALAVYTTVVSGVPLA
jgi:hypothetical protein